MATVYNDPNKAMDPAAVERFLIQTGIDLENAKNESKKLTVFVTEDGRKLFMDNNGHFIAVPDHVEPVADTLRFMTLQSICDYIQTDPDGILHGDAKYFLKINNANSVSLKSAVFGATKQRATIAICETKLDSERKIYRVDPEMFQVIVQTRFVDTEARKLLLQVAGNLKKEQGLQTADDGVSQKLTIMSGVSTTSTVKWVNPTPLRLIRTFPEIEQPESSFVFRVDSDGNCSLYEDESRVWELEAIFKIKEFLLEHVDPKSNVSIIG